jgi:aspartyl protease family protein
MLRNLCLLGVAVAISATIPVVYEANPGLLQAILDTGPSSGERIQAPVKPQTLRAEPEVLLGRKVRLAADERGHFTAEFKLNGRRVEALVDTGATYVAINRSTARRIGINLVPADFVYRVNTANGRAKAAAATIEQLQIGRIYLEDIEAVVLEDRALSATLIGMSFLKRLDRFEVENGALLLAQ